MEKKITKEIDVKIPRVPNFIFVGSEAIAVKLFTEDELRAIGEQWTKELVKKAAKGI